MADGTKPTTALPEAGDRLIKGVAMVLRAVTGAGEGIKALRRDVAGLRNDFADVRAALARLESGTGNGRGGVATESEMDAFGEAAKVNFMPRDWKDGGDFKGSLMSECPPRFLSVLAEALDSMADKPKEGKEKYVPETRRNARLARSWALRNKAKLALPPVPAATKTDPSPSCEAAASNDFDDDGATSAPADDDGDF